MAACLIYFLVPPKCERRMYMRKKLEEPDMEYEDGACTIFLYTKGTKGCPGKELKQLLHYMEDTAVENAVNSDLEEIQRMVETVKKDSEVTVEYMRMMEDEEFLKEEGREEGRKLGQAEGALRKLVSQVCRKLCKGKNADEIAMELEEDIGQIRSICDAAQELAPEYDKDSVYEKLIEAESLQNE